MNLGEIMKKNSDIWGLSLESWVAGAVALGSSQKSSGKLAQAHILPGKSAKIPKACETILKSWQKDFFAKKSPAFQMFEVESGPLFLLHPLLASGESELDAALKNSTRARFRDALGHLLQAAERAEVGALEIHFDADMELVSAGLVGLEIAAYKYKRTRKREPLKMALQVFNKGRAVPLKAVESAVNLGRGVNVARHLTNVPANDLNPETCANAVREIFAGSAVKVDVWDEARLKKEKMNLHVAVGQGAVVPPRLVHLKYRPKSGGKGKPVAIVGKGITFDTGGVNLKPSSGMRIMKKDMGGAAAVIGLFVWAEGVGLKVPLDGYLALAENSVDAHSFRPGDIITARSGQTVEIHNTDAEGRLVLADAMDVAVTAVDGPRALIDIATLTGAIKGALGASLAGLFSNDSKLSKALHQASQSVGDMVWPMPLYQMYRSQISSPFADVVNCSDGFGGAITAALFLETYAKKMPWAHLDIYAWRDSAEGAWSESGGSGQGVQLLAEYLESL